MSQLIYIDTNVWLDYCLGTNDLRPLDEFAKQLLERKINCEFHVIISDVLLFELSKYINDVDSLLHPLQIKNKVSRVQTKNEDKLFAKKINLHFPDNIHMAIAKRCNCAYFVTNDTEILSYLDEISIVDSQFFQFQ